MAKYWPESSQKFLLRAAFLEGEECARAWETWKTQISLNDEPDAGSFRLLPKLHENLKKQEIDDPLFNKLKGIAQQTWAKNQQFFQIHAPTLQALHQANFDVLLLYEPALALLYHSKYPECSSRTLGILIRPQQAFFVMKLLRETGWSSKPTSQTTLVEPYLSMGYMRTFDNSLERRLQCHWHLMPECFQSEADEDFWGGTIKTEVHSSPVRILGLADQLLHICTQDTRYSSLSTFSRAIDAMLLIHSRKTELNWDQLIERTAKYRLALPVITVLSYLQTALDNPIPTDVILRLNAIHVSKFEQIEHQAKQSKSTTWRRLLRLWFNYQRRTNNHDTAPLPKPVGFLKYLKYFWNLEHLWQIFPHMFSAIRYRFHSASAARSGEV